MDVNTQTITEDYALYHGDCLEVMPTLPDCSVHLSIYSPPFCGLYNYSSSERDLSNCRSYEEFFEHYGYVVEQLERLTLPGRCSAVHCMDIPKNGANTGGLIDFPGDIIKLHERLGWEYAARYHIWKEPLGVRNRTMAKGLAHKQVVEDASLCSVASADYLLLFRKKGDNLVPVTHENGLMWYAGERQIPSDVLKFRGHKGKQTENRFSHWIWRQYASAFWDDVRISRVLPYVESKDENDERHVHPLQLDVIERTVVLRSNPGEVVFTPFMGVGSEVWGAVMNHRRGVGVELKDTYYQQAVRNLESCDKRRDENQVSLFDE
jgi:DNA modification methylase